MIEAKIAITALIVCFVAVLFVPKRPSIYDPWYENIAPYVSIVSFAIAVVSAFVAIWTW